MEKFIYKLYFNILILTKGDYMDILNKSRVKEVYIEAKKSSNFQTYTVGYLLDIFAEDEKEIESIIKQKQAECRRLCNEEIRFDQIKK